MPHLSVSIHAPRVGSDISVLNPICAPLPFQSTLPVWGATNCRRPNWEWLTPFQSTLPVWGATLSAPVWPGDAISFNPRSPCGERLESHERFLVVVGVSIHAPRVGSDYERAGDFANAQGVSIHAPRVGSDFPRSPCHQGKRRFQSTLPVWGATTDSEGSVIARSSFNPRSPCGERPENCCTTGCNAVFQSTLPVWGATESIWPSN